VLIFGDSPTGERIELSEDYAIGMAACFGWQEPPDTLWDWLRHEVVLDGEARTRPRPTPPRR